MAVIYWNRVKITTMHTHQNKIWSGKKSILFQSIFASLRIHSSKLLSECPSSYFFRSCKRIVRVIFSILGKGSFGCANATCKCIFYLWNRHINTLIEAWVLFSYHLKTIFGSNEIKKQIRCLHVFFIKWLISETIFWNIL